MRSYSIAVLIPAHNEEKGIASCIESCLSQTRPLDQIVVVNDGSTDDTAKILKRYAKYITIITTPVATGNKSRAQEIGLRSVLTDIVITTDADTVLHPEFVEQIECNFIADPELAAVTGYVRGSSFNYLTALREIDYVIGQDLYKVAQSYLNYVFVIAGCAGAFKTDLFRKGFITFDHDTLTEDLDFTYKLHRMGLPVKFNTHAICYTQDPHDLASYANQMRRWYAGGWQNLGKHFCIVYSKPSAALYLSFNYIEGLVFSLQFLVLILINVYFFTQLLILYTFISVLMGVYAAVRRRDLRLFLFSPLGTILRLIHVYLFVEQFVKEVLLGRRNMVWFHPERRAS